MATVPESGLPQRLDQTQAMVTIWFQVYENSYIKMDAKCLYPNVNYIYMDYIIIQIAVI